MMMAMIIVMIQVAPIGTTSNAMMMQTIPGFMVRIRGLVHLRLQAPVHQVVHCPNGRGYMPLVATTLQDSQLAHLPERASLWQHGLPVQTTRLPPHAARVMILTNGSPEVTWRESDATLTCRAYACDLPSFLRP